MRKQEIKFSPGKKVEVEVAENFLRRAWGLSLRGEGKMLFKFPRPSRARIDMMLLSKPLYLYFMNSDKEVIEVQKAEPWSFNPKSWKLYSPRKPYKYLLESFEDLGVEENQKIDF